MLDARRLGGPLSVLTGLAALLGVSSLLLSATVGRQPGWLPSDDGKRDPSAFKKVGGRVAGVVREWPREARAGRPLGVLLGTSTLECAVDPRALGAEPGPGMRWLSLVAHKIDASDVESLSRLVFWSDLEPDLLVVAINPGMLARRAAAEPPDTEPADPAGVAGLLLAGRFFDARRQAGSLLDLAFPFRTRVNHLAWMTVLEARAAVARSLGRPVDRLFSPDPDPWSPPSRIDYIEEDRQAPPELIRRHWDGMARKGWFDPSCYDEDGPNARALPALVRRARAQGVEVMVVLLPATKRVRDALPPGAGRFPETVLRRAFGADAPPVLDLCDTMPDDAFYDLVHLTSKAREAFSEKLSRALRPFLTDR
jgi:hypothetical protein